MEDKKKTALTGLPQATRYVLHGISGSYLLLLTSLFSISILHDGCGHLAINDFGC